MDKLLNKLNSGGVKTPCFIFDEVEFKRGVDGFRRAFEEEGRKVVIGYSVKTNSLPYALSYARELGCRAEVVSHDEYELARSCGYRADCIIYNGPMKSEETFLEAIIGGAVVNIETKRELKWLELLPKDQMFEVGLRLSVNISKVSPEDADGDNDFSRFGFSDETEEFREALAAINRLPNVRLVGLHIHRTTHSRSVVFYHRSVSFAAAVMKKYGLHLRYLDVGGGYFGIFPNKPTFKEYAKAISEASREAGLEDITIIIEPGNALLASSFSFVSQVIDVKQVQRGLYNVAIDGSRNDIDPFFRKTGYLLDLLRQETSDDAEQVKADRQIISGCTCLEYDQLTHLEGQPLMKVGDYLRFRNVGAYTMCLTPLFIRYFPRVYALRDNSYILVREHWTAREYLMKNKLYK